MRTENSAGSSRNLYGNRDSVQSSNNNLLKNLEERVNSTLLLNSSSPQDKLFVDTINLQDMKDYISQISGRIQPGTIQNTVV